MKEHDKTRLSPANETRVSVIGGGLGGLSAAIRLAVQGYKVSLFERNSHLGGKLNEWNSRGYRFDTGPSLLTMPEVIDELFEIAGFSRDQFLSFMPVEPVCRYFWSDGSILDSSRNQQRMQSAIKKISVADAQAYPAFLEYAKGIYDISADVFLQRPIHEISEIATLENLRRLFRIKQLDPLSSMHTRVAEYFSDPRIIQLFDRFATYNGSDPYRAPSTLNIIPYVEMGLGAYYIAGGMYRLVEALEWLAGRVGVEVFTNSPVKKIVCRNQRVSGLINDEGFVAADYVVCNADVVTAHRQLIDGAERTARRLNRLEPSLSGMVFMWGVTRPHQQLKHHNIFFSADYRREFQQIFDEQAAPDDPTVYLAITSKNDSAGHSAPEQSENWFVLLNMPALNGKQNWQVEINRMRQAIFKRLASHGIDIRQEIETEQVLTPKHFLDVYGSNAGSIYGISSNNRAAAFKRMANRSRDIEGLYFAGASAHPGGGIPLVVLSGKIAAEMIIKDHNKRKSKQNEKSNHHRFRFRRARRGNQAAGTRI